MKIEEKKLQDSQIELKFEISPEEFELYFNKAFLDLARNLEIKGFRRGKVPKEVAKKELREADILIRAADIAIQENYGKALKEKRIETISEPIIDILKLAPKNPFIFKAVIFVLPGIKPPDYKKISSGIKREKVSVRDEEINNALTWLQKSRAKFTIENRPAKKGDFIEIEYQVSQAQENFPGKTTKDAFVLGQGHFFPGFEEKLIGMRAEEEKSNISVVVPENHYLKNLSGKEIKIKVVMKSVQKMEVSEITDDFAKSLGNFKNLNELKKNIKDGLNLEKERAESQRIRNEILERIIQGAEFKVPEQLLKNEQKRLIENLKKDVSQILKISFEDYLKRIKKTEKEILESFLPEAEKKLKNFLILREIGKKEGIEASEEEINSENNKILKHYSSIKEAEKELVSRGFGAEGGGLDLKKLKEYTKEAIINEKTFQFLESFVL